MSCLNDDSGSSNFGYDHRSLTMAQHKDLGQSALENVTTFKKKKATCIGPQVEKSCRGKLRR